MPSSRLRRQQVSLATSMWHELPWFVFAMGMSLATVVYIARSTGRGEMMFLDSDSMIVTLIARTLFDGQPHDWAMSAVLFVPEVAAFWLLQELTRLDVRSLQFAAGLVNFVALYLALRYCAGAITSSRVRAGVSAAAGHFAFCCLALLEGGGGRDALELASLLAMTTYYSGTLLACVLSVGLALWYLRSSGRRATVLATALVAVAAISMFSNPLYAAWCALPLTLVIAAVALRTGVRPSHLWIAIALIGGALLGYVARIPMDYWIVAEGGNYVHSSGAAGALAYYTDLAFDRLSGGTQGIIAAVLVLFAVIISALLSGRFLRDRSEGGAIVGLFAGATPVITTVGFIVLGTQAARYLQPWTLLVPFAAMLIVASVRYVPPKRSQIVVIRSLVGLSGVALVVAAVPQTAEITQSRDPSLACVTDWVNETGRPGAGQFWSIRAIKAHINSPSKLIQVDYELNGYSWLSDRTDFDTEAVSYLILDPLSYPFDLTGAVAELDPIEITCGRYRILDFQASVLDIGESWPD